MHIHLNKVHECPVNNMIVYSFHALECVLLTVAISKL